MTPLAAKASIDDRTDGDRSTDVDRALTLLRQAVADTGWTLDALAADMHIDKAHISRVLNGEKRLTLEFVVALPDDVEALFEKRRAEHFGHIVVTPAATASDAVQQLVSGLVGVLAPRLPAKASAMCKAELPTPARKVGAR